MRNYPDHMKAWVAIILMGVSILLITSSFGKIAALGILFFCMSCILLILEMIKPTEHHHRHAHH